MSQVSQSTLTASSTLPSSRPRSVDPEGSSSDQRRVQRPRIHQHDTVTKVLQVPTVSQFVILVKSLTNSSAAVDDFLHLARSVNGLESVDTVGPVHSSSDRSAVTSAISKLDTSISLQKRILTQRRNSVTMIMTEMNADVSIVTQSIGTPPSPQVVHFSGVSAGYTYGQLYQAQLDLDHGIATLDNECILTPGSLSSTILVDMYLKQFHSLLGLPHDFLSCENLFGTSTDTSIELTEEERVYVLQQSKSDSRSLSVVLNISEEFLYPVHMYWIHAFNDNDASTPSSLEQLPVTPATTVTSTDTSLSMMYTCVASGLHSPDVPAECNWYCDFADLEIYNICPDCSSTLSPTMAIPFHFSERTPQDHAQHRLQRLYVESEIPFPVPPTQVAEIILLVSRKQGITPKNTRVIQDYEVSGVYVTPTANRPQAQSTACNRNAILKSVQVYTTPLPPLWIRSGAQAFVPALGIVKIIQINLAEATHPLPDHTAVVTVGTVMHQHRADTYSPYSTIPVTTLLLRAPESDP